MHETAQIENTTFSKRVRRMLGLSLECWNTIMLASLGVGAIAAFAVVVSTFAVIQLQKLEAADARIAFAELEKEAAVARLETEKIKEVVAWRDLSLDEALELEKTLAANPGSVNLRYSDGDTESLYFAAQISHVLARAHWKVASGALKIPAVVFGITLPNTGGADAETLRKAFSAAKIPYSTNSLSNGPMVGFAISTIAGAPTLMVGSKAPPKLP